MVGAEQAVGDGDGARQGGGPGVRLGRRVTVILLHGLIFVLVHLLLLFLLTLDILPLLCKILIKTGGGGSREKKRRSFLLFYHLLGFKSVKLRAKFAVNTTTLQIYGTTFLFTGNPTFKTDNLENMGAFVLKKCRRAVMSDNCW